MTQDRPENLDLNAYVDGLLDEAQMAAVEHHLAANPDAKAEVRDYLRHKREIRTFGERSAVSARRAETDRIAQRLEKALTPGSRARTFRAAFAGLACLAIGWVSANLANDLWPDAPVFVDEAAEAHTVLANVVAGSELAGDYRRLRVAIAQLGPVSWGPDLSSFGFDLVAVNVVPTDEGAAVQHIYRSPDDKLVSFFGIRGGDGRETPRVTHRDGLGLVYWGDRAGRYALVGRLADRELTALASAAHSGAKRL